MWNNFDKPYPIFGASPDAIIDNFVVEIKCPTKEKTVTNYIKSNQIVNKYKAQIHLQMLATEKKKGLFCVADPNFEVIGNLYTAVIRPSFLYALVVWWPATRRLYIRQQLSRLQRLACISVTGATRSAPTEALEALLSLPRLHIEAEAGAMRASYRVKQWGQWRGRVQDGGHVSVLSQLVERDKLLEAPSDKIPPTYVFKKNFTVEIPSREVWNRDSDALAALHALKSPRITSQVVLECTNSLAELGQRNKVRLVWVPGHCGVTGNEEADALARKGSSDTFTGPEPAVGLPYSYPQGSIDNWTREKCQVDWSRGIGLRQARLLIKGPGAAVTRSLVSLNRANIKIITGLLTGHDRLNKHLNTIGLSPDSRCRLCGTSDEDSVHVLCHCPRVIVNRHKHFGAGYLAPEDIREIPVDKVLAFARSTGLF
ncbi:hypothetical protein NQ315_008982 [Exocentrus adspersus]|uniref:RNase H type-1 domain-containing protein n=1 Tax=Exocentrus adspersus TaxID=1586481 RepID=A0AAV8VIP4_9CUCU|nr:hypothetical protein NQ315_008982 [Exocentrus adspersus]